METPLRLPCRSHLEHIHRSSIDEQANVGEVGGEATITVVQQALSATHCSLDSHVSTEISVDKDPKKTIMVQA